VIHRTPGGIALKNVPDLLCSSRDPVSPSVPSGIRLCGPSKYGFQLKGIPSETGNGSPLARLSVRDEKEAVPSGMAFFMIAVGAAYFPRTATNSAPATFDT
jgi:hypothetical protein